MTAPAVTLTTDFGWRDPYVAAMKGVIASFCPEAAVTDLSHCIGAQQITEGALFLAGAAPWWPRGTIHVAVVDPGVGSSRQPVAVWAGGHIFVGPDNGLFHLALEVLDFETARRIENPACMLADISPTFHGRDVFAPTAGWLAAGGKGEEVGPLAGELVSLDIPAPHEPDPDTIVGEVIHMDHFGNARTNISQTQLKNGGRGRVRAAFRDIGPIRATYSDVEAGEALALIGSTGHLEIAVRNGSAVQTLGIGLGSPVRVRRE